MSGGRKKLSPLDFREVSNLEVSEGARRREGGGGVW